MSRADARHLPAFQWATATTALSACQNCTSLAWTTPTIANVAWHIHTCLALSCSIPALFAPWQITRACTLGLAAYGHVFANWPICLPIFACIRRFYKKPCRVALPAIGTARPIFDRRDRQYCCAGRLKPCISPLSGDPFPDALIHRSFSGQAMRITSWVIRRGLGPSALTRELAASLLRHGADLHFIR